MVSRIPGPLAAGEQAAQPTPFVRIGHSSGIVTLVGQPGGSLIATAGLDNTALLWDSVTGRPVAVLGGHRAGVVQLAWSPDGKLLATASLRGGATIWRADDATALRVVGEAESSITSLDWKPDGTMLALGTGGKAPGVELWEAQGPQKRRLGTTPREVTSLRWSTNGYTLAGGLAGGEVFLWEPDKADPGQRILLQHSGPVTSLSWKPNSALLASASRGESRVLLHDAASKRPTLVLDGHRAGILALAWSPNGERLATGSEDRNVVLWDTEARALQRLTDHVGPVRSLAWTPDSRQIATGSDDRSAIVWEAETGASKAVLTGLGQPVTALGWNRYGTRLIGSSALQNYGLIWDPATQELKLRLAGSASLRQRLSWVGPRRILATSPENGIALWDLETATRKAPPGGSRTGQATAGHNGGKLAFNTSAKPTTITIWSPADPPKQPPYIFQTPAAAAFAQWNRDASALAIGDAQGGMTLSAAPGGKATTLPAHRRAVSAIAWHPDGKTLISGGEDGSLALFSRTPWRKVVSLLGSVPVESLSFSPDGTRLAVEGPDGRGDVWDIPNRKLLRPFTGRLPAWSPSGKVLALDRGIWNPATGAFIAGLSKEPESVTALAWRPNGASLAVAAADGSIILREPTTGGALATLIPAGRPVISLSWSPDGKLLAAATSDGVIHLWKVDGGREIASLYSFDGGSQWLLLTPTGHFSASIRGADRLQWRVGDALLPVDRYRARFEDRKAVAAALR